MSHSSLPNKSLTKVQIQQVFKDFTRTHNIPQEHRFGVKRVIEDYSNQMRNATKGGMTRLLSLYFTKVGIRYAETCAYATALGSFNTALRINKDFIPAWYNQALTLEKLRRWEDALDAYNRILDINSKDVDVWYHKAYILMRLKRYNEAQEAFTKTLDLTREDYQF